MPIHVLFVRQCNEKLYTDKDGALIIAVGGHMRKDVNIKRLVTHLHTFSVCFHAFKYSCFWILF